jgi:oxygen-dependent protoporphyrinogen oxidase
VEAPASAPRYVLINGRLQSVPVSPPELLKSPLLGVVTKLSLGRDAMGSSKPPEQDESVANFVRRKFTAELLDRLAGPFISGIYAGDPERLSLRSAFPQVYEAEKSAGSVIRGLKQAAKDSKEPKGRPTLLSFRQGTETLVLALREKLGDAVRVSTEVTQVLRSSPTGPFALTIRATGEQDESLTTDRLIVATPTNVAGKLLRGVNQEFDTWLGGVQYAPMALVALGYLRSSVGHSLNGFGFLVPRSAKVRTLGTIWNSSLFPDRAAQNHVLLNSFAGGATDPGVVKLTAAELVQLVHGEIAPLLGMSQTPTFSHVVTYPNALPQYNLGHSERLAKVEQLRLGTSGLWLTGNYLRGPAIGTCVEQSLEVAHQVAADVIQYPAQK